MSLLVACAFPTANTKLLRHGEESAGPKTLRDQPSVHCVAPEARRVPHEVEQWPCDHDHFGRKLFSSTTALTSAQSAPASSRSQMLARRPGERCCVEDHQQRYDVDVDIRRSGASSIATSRSRPRILTSCGWELANRTTGRARAPCACEGAVLPTVWRKW